MRVRVLVRPNRVSVFAMADSTRWAWWVICPCCKVAERCPSWGFATVLAEAHISGVHAV